MTEYRLFTDADFILKETDPELSYRRRGKDEKKSVPWGQRKLFLTELQFINRYWDPTLIPKPVFLYIGAAPGRHIPFLSSLYPEITFYLYDPQAFHITESEKIKIRRQYFTDKDAKKWAKRRANLYMVSDIRSADYTKMSPSQNEETIHKDMNAQLRWYQTIKPVQAHLKFRLPYPVDGKAETINYLDGTLYKQPWAPQTSTETRLVPFGPDKFKTWDTVNYESQLFYYNVVVREKIRYLNPFTNDESHIFEDELVNDADSLMETMIFVEYFKRRGLSASQALVSSMSKLLTTNLNMGRSPEDWYTLARLRADVFLIKRRYNPDFDKDEQVKDQTTESTNN